MDSQSEKNSAEADGKPKTPKKTPKHWFDRRRRTEADCLLDQVVKKAEKRTGQSAAGAEPTPSTELRCFLEHRFKEPLLKYGFRGPAYGRAFTYLSVSVVAAGFASSAISADQDTAGKLRWLLFGLGVLVALFTAINQLWKPGMRSVGSYRAGNALRREGWDFVLDSGRYRAVKDKPNEAFDLFVDQIREIQSQVDAIDEIQAEISSSSSNPDGQATGDSTATTDGGD